MKQGLIKLALVCALACGYLEAEDVATFTSQKCEELCGKLQESYSGLNDEEKVNILLANQCYVEVLKHLWSEEDAKKRCQWLEAKVEEGHPILMFELAEAYFLEDPTVECYLQKAMPWIIAGATRTVLDARCTEDKNAASHAEVLLFNYQQRILCVLTAKVPLEKIEEYVLEHEELFQKESTTIQRKVFKPFEKEDPKMPSPKWVFTPGVKSSIPESQYDSIRKKSAETLISMVSGL